jgi:hypothetical protein
MFRLLSFTTLIILTMVLPWQLTIVSICIYAAYFEGFEVIMLGFLLDTFLGTRVPWMSFPAVFTIATTGILFVVWSLKPLIFLTDVSFRD